MNLRLSSLARWRVRLAKLMPGVVMACVALWSVTPSGQALEERLGLEFLFALRGETTPPEQVAVIAITRNSARALGHSEKLYEWSRAPYGELVDALSALGVQHIVFDMYFEAPRDAAGDQAFAQAIARAGNVLLFARSNRERVGEAELDTLSQPMPILRQAAITTAPLVLPKVPARVSRFFVRHPSFSDVLTLHAAVWAQQQPSANAAITQLHRLPAALPLNLYGPPRTLRTIELSDLLQQPEAHRAALQGSTVFVGYSASEQPDQRDGFYTAFSSPNGLDISGVELAATAYANLRDEVWLREPLPWQNAILLLIVGALMYSAARWLPPLVAGGVVGGAVALITVACWWFFERLNVWLPWFHLVVVMLPLCGGLGMWVRNRELFNQKQRLQWAFGKYLPQEELARLQAEKGLPALRDYHHSVCLVTDAQGYSRLSETLSPVALAELMQDYYHAIIPPIRKAGGIISDVAGDGIIALWLHLDPDRVWAKLQSVIHEINANIDQFNQTHAGCELPTRIGIHAGEMVLGHFGAMDHHEFRAMGDIINTTARLESANKQFGTRVLISEDCASEQDAGLRYVGRFRFAGKRNPLRVFTLNDAADPVLIKQYQLALMKLEAGQVDQARKTFHTIQKYYPDDQPTRFFVQYLSELDASNVGDWLYDGAISLHKK